MTLGSYYSSGGFGKNLKGASVDPSYPGKSKSDAAYLAKYDETAGYGSTKLPTAGGTGLSFLSGLNYRGRGLLDGGGLLDPIYGGKNRFNSPFMLAKFLAGEMGPGGALAEGTQSYETGLGIHGILGQGRQAREQAINTLGASGLGKRYATSIADVYDSTAMEQALAYQAQQHGELSRQRYNAMSELMNSIAQTAQAEKVQSANYAIAKKGAKATMTAGALGALGTIAGAALGGPAGGVLGGYLAGSASKVPGGATPGSQMDQMYQSNQG